MHIHGSDPPEKFGPPPGANDYNPPRAYGHQPQYQKSEEEDAFGSCLDKVGLAVGGLVAAGGVAAAMHAYNVSLREMFRVRFDLEAFGQMINRKTVIFAEEQA